jgi:hypothetical protein
MLKKLLRIFASIFRWYTLTFLILISLTRRLFSASRLPCDAADLLPLRAWRIPAIVVARRRRKKRADRVSSVSNGRIAAEMNSVITKGCSEGIFFFRIASEWVGAFAADVSAPTSALAGDRNAKPFDTVLTLILRAREGRYPSARMKTRFTNSVTFVN